MKSRHHQNGLSTLALLAILLVASFFVTCVIKLLPVYMESFSVDRAVEVVVEEVRSGKLESREIKNRLGRQFQVNRVEAIQPREVKVTRTDGKTVVDATYEKRIPLMFNIDVVIKFDKFIYEI